jgi:hypothetical protein
MLNSSRELVRSEKSKFKLDGVGERLVNYSTLKQGTLKLSPLCKELNVHDTEKS